MTTIQAEGDRTIEVRSRMVRCVAIGEAAGPDETSLIDAVRRGDDAAFGALYELHLADVRRLARRLSRDRYEADDVVSEVFCNTLRALQRGAGPTDSLGPYLLRSVRNTLIKTRTRTDTAHATPTSTDALDRADDGDHFAAPGPATVAFGAVSERHRRILWEVEIEGTPTSEVAVVERMAAPAAASLAYRARCSLRRAFLSASIPTTVDQDCAPVRALMARFIDDGLGRDKSATVEAHVALCGDCAAALQGARRLKSSLGSKSPFAMLLLGGRSAAAAAERAVTGLIAISPFAALSGAAAVALGVGAIVAVEPLLHEQVSTLATTDVVAVGSGPPHSIEPDTVLTADSIESGAPAASLRTSPPSGPDDRSPHLDAPILVESPTDAIATAPGVDLPPGAGITLPRGLPSAAPADDLPNSVDDIADDAIATVSTEPTDAVETVLDTVDDTLATTSGAVTSVVAHTTESVDSIVATVSSSADQAGSAAVVVVDRSTDAVDAVVDTLDSTTQTVTDLDIVHPVVGDVVADVMDGASDQTVTQTVDDVVVGAVDTVGGTLDSVLGLLPRSHDDDQAADQTTGGGRPRLLGFGD